ncbi:hypothetical protein ACGFZK_07520 [Streptomyces sp. NPDC048257]|uniref:hypothetical protein n=1 Tax=Streptomyces sp. NPDC048257 TaxID=3365526 RepID=UPI0037101E7D
MWHSYYDDVLVQGPSGVDIDHMVPLAEVHDSGGYSWTTERRRRYANDLGSDVTLVGVTARSNRQKSDQDPATWMPAPAVHCRRPSPASAARRSTEGRRPGCPGRR